MKKPKWLDLLDDEHGVHFLMIRRDRMRACSDLRPAMMMATWMWKQHGWGLEVGFTGAIDFLKHKGTKQTPRR